MSSTSGKVALVNNTTTLTGACPTGAAGIIDFVGYGTEPIVLKAQDQRHAFKHYGCPQKERRLF